MATTHRPGTMKDPQQDGAKNRRTIRMATTRVDIIDRSVEQANVWINDVADEFGTADCHQAYAFCVRFCTRCATTFRSTRPRSSRRSSDLRARRVLRGLGPQPYARACPRRRHLSLEDRHRSGLVGRDRGFNRRQRRQPRPAPPRFGWRGRQAATRTSPARPRAPSKRTHVGPHVAKWSSPGCCVRQTGGAPKGSRGRCGDAFAEMKRRAMT